MGEIEELKREIKDLRKLIKQVVDTFYSFHTRWMTLRSRLAILTIMHRDELAGMGFNMERWIKDLEIEPRQLHMLELNLKRKGV